MADIDIADQISCIEREIGYRVRVYPRWVAAGKMTQAKADLELARMQAALNTLREVENERKAPDLFSQALNEGDGTYRP